MTILISGQYGEPKADDVFWPMHRKLNDCFKKYLSGRYFETLKELSIVFRVSGKVHDFASEGPERMRYLKRDSSITIDLVFPETSWRDVDGDTLRIKVSEGIRECLHMLLGKAAALGEVKDLDTFSSDFEKAISEFLRREA